MLSHCHIVTQSHIYIQCFTQLPTPLPPSPHLDSPWIPHSMSRIHTHSTCTQTWTPDSPGRFLIHSMWNDNMDCAWNECTPGEFLVHSMWNDNMDFMWIPCIPGKFLTHSMWNTPCNSRLIPCTLVGIYLEFTWTDLDSRSGFGRDPLPNVRCLECKEIPRKFLGICGIYLDSARNRWGSVKPSPIRKFWFDRSGALFQALIDWSSEAVLHRFSFYFFG